MNLLYWTVGNPGPQIDRSVRGELDNLFSDSVVAIDPDTGQRKWHYQFTPNDGHDWDSCQDVILVDRVWRRAETQAAAARGSQWPVLRARSHVTGEFLVGDAVRLPELDEGFDAKGRPIQVPGSNSSPAGSFFVYPSLIGGTNFQAPSYSPLTGWMYLQDRVSGQRYISAPDKFDEGKQYIGRAQPTGAEVGPKPGEPAPSGGIKALDAETGKTMWDFKLAESSHTSGVLATAGNVLFVGTREGHLVALDARSGKPLWRFQTGANMNASPMSYAIGGRQYVADRLGQHAVRLHASGVAACACGFSRRVRRVGVAGSPGGDPAVQCEQTGEVVQLSDAKNQTTVSIVPASATTRSR